MKRMPYINLIKFNEKGEPICEEHGAMHLVNKEGTLYRCAECHIGIDIKNIYRFVEKEIRWFAEKYIKNQIASFL